VLSTLLTRSALFLSSLLIMAGCSLTPDKHEQINRIGPRISLTGFSFTPPNGHWWRKVTHSKSELILFGKPYDSEHGRHSSAIVCGIYKGMDYSRDGDAFLQQIQNTLASDDAHPHYSNRQYRAEQIIQGGAECVLTSHIAQDDETVTSIGIPYTIHIDDLLCLHPTDAQLVVKLSVMQRVPPGTQTDDFSGIKERIFNSLEFSQ